MEEKDKKANTAPEKVEVDPNALKSVLERLDVMERASKEKDEQIEILRQSVSRYRLEEAEYKKDRAEGLPRAKLMKHDGKAVVAWQWTKQEYIFNPLTPNVPQGEDLRLKLVYTDGSTSQEMPYINFVRNIDRTEVEKIGETSLEKNGKSFTAWVVRSLDGTFDKDLTVNPDYLNP